MTTNATGIAGIIKQPQMLREEDSIRKAAAVIGSGDGSSAIVRLSIGGLGVVTEREIAAYLASADMAQEGAAVGQIAKRLDTFISDHSDPAQVAKLFADSGPDLLPVIDNYGVLRGVVFRRDLIALMTGSLRPPSVGGLATPLGVRLTSGNYASGASDLGMALTGVAMMAMVIAATLMVYGLDWLIRYGFHSFPAVKAMIPSSYVPTIETVWEYVGTALSAVLMMLMIRFSPLSGYHAAEHMTVHAIETGEDLTPEAVRRMDRVHPRCGSNLLAAAAIFIIITDRLGTDMGVVIALIAVLAGWRQVGALMQKFITTKPPTEKQLASGIAAGRELLAKYQANPGKEVTGFKRLWNAGFLQAASGWIAISLILMGLSWLFHVKIPI